MYYDCLVWIENSVPRQASWCRTVTLGTDFSIHTKQSWYILIVFTYSANDLECMISRIWKDFTTAGRWLRQRTITLKRLCCVVYLISTNIGTHQLASCSRHLNLIISDKFVENNQQNIRWDHKFHATEPSNNRKPKPKIDTSRQKCQLTSFQVLMSAFCCFFKLLNRSLICFSFYSKCNCVKHDHYKPIFLYVI